MSNIIIIDDYINNYEDYIKMSNTYFECFDDQKNINNVQDCNHNKSTLNDDSTNSEQNILEDVFNISNDSDCSESDDELLIYNHKQINIKNDLLSRVSSFLLNKFTY